MVKIRNNNKAKVAINQGGGCKGHEEPYESRGSRTEVRPDKAGVLQQELVLRGEEPEPL